MSTDTDNTSLIKYTENNGVEYYEYDEFINIEEINNGLISKVYKANRKQNNSKLYFILKYFDVDKATAVKEIVHEIKLRQKIIRDWYMLTFLGITIDTDKCLLVMGYAEGGSLHNYLKEKFSSLDWRTKYRFAIDLSSAIEYLHENGIIHQDLHSNSILVQHDIIQLADLGLSKRMMKTYQISYDTIPYDPPEGFHIVGENNTILYDPPEVSHTAVDEKTYSSEQIEKMKKGNVYSVGVLLWELSSGKRPFADREYNVNLSEEITQGLRECVVEGTPEEYSSLYKSAWNGDPDKRPTIEEIVTITKNLYQRTIVREFKLNYGLYLDGHSIKPSKQPVLEENGKLTRKPYIGQPLVYTSINDRNSSMNLLSFNSDDKVEPNEALRPSDVCIEFPIEHITYDTNLLKSFLDFVGDEKTLNIKYGHLLAKTFVLGGKLFIDDLMLYTPSQVNTIKLLLNWTFYLTELGGVRRPFNDFFTLDFFPKIRTSDGKSLNNPEELIRWVKDLHRGTNRHIISYDNLIPISELGFNASLSIGERLTDVANFKEKLSLEKWFGDFLYGNPIKWIQEFKCLNFNKMFNRDSNDEIAVKFINAPDIELSNKSYIEVIVPTTNVEDFLLQHKIFSIKDKDIRSFPFIDRGVVPRNNGPYIVIKFEKYIISLNSIKPTEEFKQAAEKAIESMEPIANLQELFDKYGQMFPKRIIIGNFLRGFFLNATNFHPVTSEKVDLESNQIETLQTYLDALNITFLVTDTGDTFKPNDLEDYINYDLGLVKNNEILPSLFNSVLTEYENIVPLHHILDLELQKEIDCILNAKDDFKIILAGTEDLIDLLSTSYNNYSKTVNLDESYKFCHDFEVFGSIISKNNLKVEDILVKFTSGNDRFIAEITKLPGSDVNIRECHILWMIVGIPSKLSIFSPKNRELQLEYVRESITLRPDDRFYYPIKIPRKLTRGEIVTINTEFSPNYWLRFVNWSNDYIYLQMLKNPIDNGDKNNDKTITRDVHICILPFDSKYLKTDNKGDKCDIKLIGSTLTEENFIRENALQVTDFAKRPSLGSRGREIRVHANFFEVTSLPKTNIHQYSFTVSPRIPSLLMRKVFQMFDNLYNKDRLNDNLLVFDGRRNIFTCEPLPFKNSDTFNIILPDDNSTLAKRHLEIKIKKVSEISMDELRRYLNGKSQRTPSVLKSIMVLNALAKHQTSMKYVSIGRSFYTRDGFKSLTGIAEAWKGYYQSARPTPGKMMINVDLKATAFCESGPLVNIIVKLLGKKSLDDFREGISEKERNKLEKELKNHKIRVVHRKSNQHYYILKITPQDAEGTTFNDADGHSIDVASYFQKKYKPLTFPYLPCVMVEEEVFFPMELCEVIENQRYIRKLDERQTAEIIKFACQPPHHRAKKIKTGLKELGYNSKLMAQFNMKVSNEMAIVKARILPTPTINYHPSSKEASFVPNGGVWNLEKKKFAIGATLFSWSILVFGPYNEQSVKRFLRDLINACSNAGMNISNKDPPIIRGNTQGNVEENLKKAWVCAGNATKSKPQLVICVLPNVSSQLYGSIKHVGDTILGVVTQCIQSKYLSKAKNQYFSNICLKINAKLGGTNSFLTLKQNLFLDVEKSSILMGADVTHSAGSSIAALCASVDLKASRYATSIRLQHSARTEIIFELADMVRDMLKNFYKNCNRNPMRILFYRDGVSEGQFEQVFKVEIEAIKSACYSYSEGYSPTITYVIVQKRHHARFFPINNKDSDRTGNCLPGTLIETGVVHPSEFDFYLQSHAALQGTCRPTHYHVLYDENKFTSDSLQTLSYNLCYTYARCTRAVSIVPPVYYAHLACKRARFHIREDFSESSSMEGDSTQVTLDTAKPELQNGMYFI